jgi:DNA helicase-2/ATP-dependent DNA helicase PcrA
VSGFRPRKPIAVTAVSQVSIAPVLGLEDDEAGSRIVAEELRLLDTALAAFASAAKSEESMAQSKLEDDARMLELRDDISVAKPEDLPALFEQMHHVAALREQRGKSKIGALDPRSPYFGHLRISEAGKRRDVLIGARAYIDPRSAIRIVDWRHAPVSRIFYRYQEEEDYEEEMGGRQVEGKVLARRTVTIDGGQLVRVSSPQGTYVRGAEGRWRKMGAHVARLQTEGTSGLGVGAGEVQRDKHLPAIASMLDAAQFEMISKPGSGLAVLQGSAGSGKTTVGLHRAAYLAYADPVRFRSDRILVAVPNEALRHYVGHVLPTLGVGDVKVTTFARLAAEVLPSIFPRLPERVSDDTPPVVSRAKAHPRMLVAMSAARDRVVKNLEDRVKKAMDKWPDGDVVLAAFAATKELGSPDARVTALSQWTNGRRKLEGMALAATLPEVTRHALEKLVADLHHVARVVQATWDELLTSKVRLQEIFDGAFSPTQIEQIHTWCVKQARIRAEGERDGDLASIDEEDQAILLRLYQLIRGPLPDLQGKPLIYHHMFVDEVQDSSPVQLRVLLGMCSKDLCVTLAGDSAQRMLEDDDERGELDWNELLTELEVPHVKLEPLKVSYRSTAEITRFARGVLGPLAHDAEPIATRSGPPVELFSFASQGEAVIFLADALKQLARTEPYANVAILARFPQQAQVYYEGLERADVPNVRRIAKLDFTWEPGFDVTDIRSTKGLEFDEVVVVDVNESSFPDSPQARHALYVGATRAAHQLWCISSDKPSPIAKSALE